MSNLKRLSGFDLCRAATLAALLIVGGFCVPGESVIAADKPNILFLFADDQRADAIEGWDNPHIKTPRLNQLVEQGISFRNNYCFGSNSGAVCMPSRAMVHTGKLWLNSNNQMQGEVTLGELLQQHGYNTFATGKWHNGKSALLRSFQSGDNVFMGGMCDHLQVPIAKIEDGQLIPQGTGDDFSSTLFADAAVQFLNQQADAEQPFFAYVAFTAPHDPRQPPQAYRDVYYNDPPPLPANFLPQHPFNNSNLIIRDEVLAGWPRSEQVIQDQLSEYYGLVTQMDEQIGRILAALQKLPQAENTIIVYAADHGLALGSHGLLGKQNLYEHSMKCPLIFVGPGIPHAQSQAFTYLHDIYPTLCSLANIEPPADLAGFDLSQIWNGDLKQVRDSVFLPYQNSQRAFRKGDWKLIVYPKINHQQLFNLAEDPHELNNLAEDPEFADKMAQMTFALKQAQLGVGDQLPLTTDNPIAKTIDLTGKTRKPDRHQPQWIIEKYFE